MSMNYALDSYASFQEEHDLLEAEIRKKEEHERQQKEEQRAAIYRYKCVSGYFLRLSWRTKKQFILSIIENINCLDTLLQIINYISTLFGKMATYIDVSPHCKSLSQQIVIDHNRNLDAECITETIRDDLEWMKTVPLQKLSVMIMELLNIAGGALLRKIYIPLVNIYNKKIMEQQLPNNHKVSGDLNSIFDDTEQDDSDKYPRDHPLTVEVEKLRKKWEETIDKYRQEVFGIEKQENKETELGKKSKNDKSKLKKTEKVNKKEKIGGKNMPDSVDWIQMLPIWIVKKILNHFDQKTLQNFKKVNSYWAYACDSLIKDRQARDFLNKTIKSMVVNVNQEVLEKHRKMGDLVEKTVTKPDSPREKRTKKLMTRAAVVESMRPKVKKSSQVRWCLITSMPKEPGGCSPIDKILIFPRLIREDLLLYKTYPCILKDVNILIDVEENIRKRRETLSYSLSQQLTDTFSMSEANLADW